MKKRRDLSIKKTKIDPEEILNALSDLILVKDSQSKLLWANNAFLGYYGMSLQDLEQIDAFDAPHSDPDDTLQYLRDDLHVISTGNPLRKKEPVNRFDGLIEYFETIKTPILNTSGETTGTVGVARKLIDQESTEDLQQDRLRRKKMLSFQKTFLNQVAVAAIFLDANQRLTAASPRFSKIFEINKRDYLGKSVHEIFQNPNIKEIQFTSQMTSYNNLQLGIGEIDLMGDVSVTPWFLNDHEVGGHFLVFENRSEQMELLRLLKEEKQLSIINDRVRTMGELSAGVAHEVNNPLAIIQAILEKIRIVYPNIPKALQTDLHGLRVSANRISEIVKGLKSLSRDSSRDPFEYHDLTAILNSTISLCQSKMKAYAIELFVDIESHDHWSTFCRPGEISQVLFNLIDNAIDAILEQDHPWIRIQASKSSGYLVINILDSGARIPPEVLEKIFDPFYTTKKPGQGTGLGLGICQRIMSNHNGYFRVNPDRPHTCFELKFRERNEDPSSRR